MSATYALVFGLGLLCAGCAAPRTSWSKEELSTLGSFKNPPVRVLTVNDSADLKILRTPSIDLTEADLSSKEYAKLAEMLKGTVTDSSQAGVGIAAPQVGINRRVIAVQRYDKPGEPFEVYANIKLEYMSSEKAEGPEGCLSIPGVRGTVSRSKEIGIRYGIMDGGHLRDTTERVSGFTAVIFQHEIDHLEGILFTDRIKDKNQEK